MEMVPMRGRPLGLLGWLLSLLLGLAVGDGPAPEPERQDKVLVTPEQARPVLERKAA